MLYMYHVHVIVYANKDDDDYYYRRIHLQKCGLHDNLNLGLSVSLTNYQYTWKIKLEKALPPVLLHYEREMAWNERSSIIHAFQNENKYYTIIV